MFFSKVAREEHREQEQLHLRDKEQLKEQLHNKDKQYLQHIRKTADLFKQRKNI